MAKKAKYGLGRFRKKVFIIDNSVLLKAFFEEEGGETVRRILRMAAKKQTTLLAPTLMVFEFLNVLSKSLKDIDDIKDGFKKFKKLAIGFIDPEDKYVLSALENISEKKQISYYDASYHALAKDYDAIFLTTDRKYFSAMKEKGNIWLF